MNEIWEFAKKMETEGKKYYQNLAAKAKTREIAGVFGEMAEEEEKHYRIFEALSTGNETFNFVSSKLLGNAKSTFAKFAVTTIPEDSVKDATDAYGKALEMEKQGIAYYEKALGAATDAPSRKALELIIAEEKSHVRIIESLTDFVQRPKEWLEDAEFTHLDEY